MGRKEESENVYVGREREKMSWFLHQMLIILMKEEDILMRDCRFMLNLRLERFSLLLMKSTATIKMASITHKTSPPAANATLVQIPIEMSAAAMQ